jgi:hypothetical protein
MAMVNVLVVAGLAAGTRTVAGATWAALLSFVLLAVLAADTVTGLVALLVGCVAVLVLVGLAVERADLRRTGG